MAALFRNHRIHVVPRDGESLQEAHSRILDVVEDSEVQILLKMKNPGKPCPAPPITIPAGPYRKIRRCGVQKHPWQELSLASLPTTKTAHHTTVTFSSFNTSPVSKCISFPRRQASLVPESQSQDIDSHLQVDKLVISQLGLLAQRRLARGLRLNHSEACVYVTFYIRNYAGLLMYKSRPSSRTSSRR
jgi:hypothetical protein